MQLVLIKTTKHFLTSLLLKFSTLCEKHTQSWQLNKMKHFWSLFALNALWVTFVSTAPAVCHKNATERTFSGGPLFNWLRLAAVPECMNGCFCLHELHNTYNEEWRALDLKQRNWRADFPSSQHHQVAVSISPLPNKGA